MAKSVKKEGAEKVDLDAKKEAPSEPSEMVIKEIMVQKNVTREKAIEILKNPS